MSKAAPVTVEQWEGLGGRKAIGALRKKLRLVYVAGPMRGYEDFNFPAFDQGRDYVNLLELDDPDEPQPARPLAAISPADMDRARGFQETETDTVSRSFYQDCMRRDLEVVANSYAIFLLKDWEKSEGANNELFVARVCGVKVWLAVYDEEEEDLIIGHREAPSWLRSPRIFGDNGLPVRTEKREDIVGPHLEAEPDPRVEADPRHVNGGGEPPFLKYAAKLGNLVEDEKQYVEHEVDQVLSLPPENPNEPKQTTVDETPTVLEEANHLIFGPRNSDYGHPLDDFTRTGRMWGAIVGALEPGQDIPAEKVGLMMIALKISREVNRHKRDNIVDMGGYAGTVDMVVAERERRQEEERQEWLKWLQDLADDPSTDVLDPWGEGKAEVIARIVSPLGGVAGEFSVFCGCGSKTFTEDRLCTDCGSSLEDALVKISD